MARRTRGRRERFGTGARAAQHPDAAYRAGASRAAAYRAAAYRAAVLEVVNSIPPGRVMAYSAIANYFADPWRIRSPRLIGRIMAGCDEDVPWHRVVQASGVPVRGHEAEALRRLERDGTPMRGRRIDMHTAAWAPDVPPRPPD